MSWDDNFASAPYINSNIFPVRWGNNSEFYSANGGLTLYDNGTAAGFMRWDNGASSGDGYGTYSVTMSANMQTGTYVDIWPSTNNWPGPELDLCEFNGGRAYVTVHWNNNGSNDYSYYWLPSNVNLANKTTIALDWERGNLTYYVNGQQFLHLYSGETGAPPIPKDYADGGQNGSFGVGLAGGENGASMTLYDMSYNSGGGGGSAPASSSQPVGPISISNPGTISGSAPVSENITFSDPGLANQTIYAVTMNPNNVFEEGWIPITLNSSGVASHSMTFKETGDYVIAVSNQSNDANKGVSGRVTITAGGSSSGTTSSPTPSSWISISDPGTVTSSGGGAWVTEHFSDPGLAGCYAFVMTKSYSAETAWQWVPFNAQGQGSLSMHFANTGDFVLAVANTSTNADKSWSSPITIK